MAEKNEKHQPSISVIIPVYNVKLYLCECLNSVINQSFTDLEIIVVDDGSTDGSEDICDEYAKNDARICVIHKANGGLGNARNVGMDIANGKYIVFLDSDDYWDLATAETLYMEAEKNSVEVLVFGAKPFFDGIESCDRINNYEHKAQNLTVKHGAESLKTARENGEYYSSACLRFYLVNYLRKINIRFDEGIIHEDEKFSFVSYLFADRVECIEDRLYNRRYRSESIMTSKNTYSSAYGYLTSIDGILKATEKCMLSELQRNVFADYIKSMFKTIRERYAQLYFQKSEDSKKNSIVIKKKAKPILKKIRALHLALSAEEYLATYSLWVGLCVRRANKKFKKIRRR